jgi:ABC-2 type transport system ATP-binding protein
MIEVQNLTRVFRTYKKQPGFWGGVKGLFHRTYDETAAAKDVSFSIAEGEFVGFLGPNAYSTMRRVERVTLLGVAEKLNVMVRELSLGERMKMELIAALIHRPKVLFLDEPTIGLDIVSQRAVRDFLRDYNRRHRVTIILTSHYMADIKELCERVIVIHKGSKIYDGALDRLESGSDSRKKIVCFVPKDGAFAETWRSKFGDTMRASDGTFTLRVSADDIVAVAQEVLASGPVADITIEDVPLEDIIAELFKVS